MYFNNLPLVSYPDFNNQNQSVVLTNILTRSSFLQEIMDNSAIFYEYQIKENETPEIIADKLYGDPNRHWIILMFNQILNPLYEFPLSQDQLNELITKKYDQTIEQSMTTIHHYEQRAHKKILLNGIEQSGSVEIYTISEQELDFNTGLLVTTPFLPGTADTFLDAGSDTAEFDDGITVETSYTNWAISNHTYEVQENEQRRNIKLLDKNYVVPVENEFRRLMRDEN